MARHACGHSTTLNTGEGQSQIVYTWMSHWGNLTRHLSTSYYLTVIVSLLLTGSIEVAS